MCKILRIWEKKNWDYDECFMWGGEGRNMYKYGRK